MNSSNNCAFAYSENKELSLPRWKPSGWKCYLFGSTPDNPGIVYIPAEGNVPNWFVRWMMKICFACTWVEEKNNEIF